MDETTNTVTVTDVRLPTCSNGRRSGWATAIVDGVPMRLHTSRPDRTDYYEHQREVAALFVLGEGEPI